MDRRLTPLAALLTLWAALCAPAAWAAGTKTSGTSQIVDDLPTGAAGTVHATAGTAELDGSLGQLSDIISEESPGHSVEAGYFSMLVSTPDTAGYNKIFGTSVSFQWTDAIPPNPTGTTYTIDMSTDAGYGGVLISSSDFGLAGQVTGLKGNSTYYSRIHASYAEGDDSGVVNMGRTNTQAAIPASGSVFDNGPFTLRAHWDPLSNSGGELTSPWSVLGTTLPLVRQGHAMVFYGGNLYVSGGVDAAATSNVWLASVLTDGTVSSWTATTPLPAPRESHAMAAWGGRLYVVGGSDGAARSTVWWAPIRSNGSLGDWTATSPLPAGRFKHAMIASGGRLYVTGGDNGVFSQSTVYYADINNDGTITAWSTSGALPASRSGHAMAVSSGTLYLSGGVGASVETIVWRSILTGGIPGAWEETTPLPEGRTRHTMTAASGKLLVCGGHDGSDVRPECWIGDVAADKNVASWIPGTSLPAGLYLHAAASSGERLYIAGGSDGVSPTEPILSTPLRGTEYLAERADNPGFTVNLFSGGWRTGTAFDFGNLTPNTAYFARVRARSFGNVETPTLSLGSPVTFSAMPATAASTFTAVEIGSVSFQWTRGFNPVGTEFRAQASTSPTFGGTLFTSNWATVVSTGFNGLSVNTSYYVRAQSRNSQLLESPFTVLGATFTLAAVPKTSTITAASAAGLRIEWSPDVNPLLVTRYEAQVATGPTFSPIIQSSVTLSTAAVFSALSSASTFYVRVRALNGNNVASLFDVTVSTPTGLDAVAPGVSTGTFAVQNGQADSLAVSWVAPGDNGYSATLVANASFYVQWSTSDPVSVQWSTEAAQVRVTTGPVIPGSRATIVINGLPDQKTVFLRVWTKDQANNYSSESAVFSAFSSPFTFESLEGGGGFDAGASPAIVADSAGNLHAAYQGTTGSQELRYAKRTAGVWGAPQTVDPGVIVSNIALAVGADGNPQILYRDVNAPRMKLARFAGSWTPSVVEEGDFVPGGLALDAGARAHVSYYEAGAGHLKFARWTGTGWIKETVDSSADTGRESALALDGFQHPHISYYDATNMSLKYASSTTEGVWVLQTVDAGVNVGTSPALALDGEGRAHIAYGDASNLDVKYASWTGTGWSLRVVESAGSIGGLRLGLALDATGAAVISYSDRADADLKVARWLGTGFSTQTVDSGADQGVESSLAVDGAGGLRVAYRDATSRAFKVAHWAAAVPPPFGGNAGGRSQAPGGFSGAVISATSIQWSWTDASSNEMGFRLYGSLVSTGPFTLIAGTETLTRSAGVGGVKSYTELGLTEGTTYYRYAVAVGTGGAVASAQDDAYPFNTSDQTPPSIVNNQSGDDLWRRLDTTRYDVDFFDTGGAQLSKFQVKASTVALGAGPDRIGYTDAVVNINADSYTTDWPIPSTVFTAMQDGVTNYVTIKVIDGNGNATIAVDAFYVRKDTTAPSLVNNQATDDIPRVSAPPAFDVDALDGVSGLAAFQYSVSTKAGTGDASVIAWTDIAALSNTTFSVTNWTVDFNSLAVDSRNYVSVRSWDVAGTTRTITDAFTLIRVSGGPSIAITNPTATHLSALATVSGVSVDTFGIQGVEVAFQDSPPSGLFWGGASFNSAAAVWFTASGTATWSYNSTLPWVDQTQYAVIARSSDTGNNYSTTYATATFTLDTSLPGASIGIPTTGGTIASLPSVTGTAADPGGGAASGIASIELRLRRNSDGLWWNFFAETWSATAVSTNPVGTSSWIYLPSPGLRANLAHGTSYYLAVRATDNALPANVGSFFAAGSSTFNFTDTAPPDAIADLTGFSGAAPGEIRLSWTAPGDDGAAGIINLGQFRIQYSSFTPVVYSTSDAQVVIATASVRPGGWHSKLLTGLIGGDTYYIGVWTQDDAGNWSPLSNGATVLATPNPSTQILGHVMKVSSEGITAVQLDCWDSSGAWKATSFTLADGSGSFTLDGLTAGTYKVQATWSANGVSSSVWLDGIPVGMVDLDFLLQLDYTLGTLTGTLQTLSTGQSALGLGVRMASFNTKAVPTATDARVELYQGNRKVGEVGVESSGRWRIPNLLPGRYAVRAFNGFDYTDMQSIDLAEGEIRDVTFVFDPLPKEKVFAFPNPARQATTFRFESSLVPLEAQITVFDIAGNLVKEIPGYLVTSPAPGVYHATWNLDNDRGSPVASGVYLFSVRVKGGLDQTAKVIKKLAVVR